MVKIDKKIVSYQIVDNAAKKKVPETPKVSLTERPECLESKTYRLKTPLSEQALYITIGDITLHPGTPDEVRRPFEIFINCKAMEHFQWIVALTRITSAVFRMSENVDFLINELKEVFDPRGGYWQKGRLVPSLVAEIGMVIERHVQELKARNEPLPAEILPREFIPSDHEPPVTDSFQSAFQDTASFGDCPADILPREREPFDYLIPPDESSDSSASFPAHATRCEHCGMNACVKKDGCQTCLACGDSKCG
jgi:hypothetical protein